MSNALTFVLSEEVVPCVDVDLVVLVEVLDWGVAVTDDLRPDLIGVELELLFRFFCFDLSFVTRI